MNNNKLLAKNIDSALPFSIILLRAFFTSGSCVKTAFIATDLEDHLVSENGLSVSFNDFNSSQREGEPEKKIE